MRLVTSSTGNPRIRSSPPGSNTLSDSTVTAIPAKSTAQTSDTMHIACKSAGLVSLCRILAFPLTQTSHSFIERNTSLGRFIIFVVRILHAISHITHILREVTTYFTRFRRLVNASKDVFLTGFPHVDTLLQYLPSAPTFTFTPLIFKFFRFFGYFFIYLNFLFFEFRPLLVKPGRQ